MGIVDKIGSDAYKALKATKNHAIRWLIGSSLTIIVIIGVLALKGSTIKSNLRDVLGIENKGDTIIKAINSLKSEFHAAKEDQEYQNQTIKHMIDHNRWLQEGHEKAQDLVIKNYKGLTKEAIREILDDDLYKDRGLKIKENSMIFRSIIPPYVIVDTAKKNKIQEFTMK